MAKPSSVESLPNGMYWNCVAGLVDNPSKLVLLAQHIDSLIEQTDSLESAELIERQTINSSIRKLGGTPPNY
jgi:hypothetical protein